MRAVSKTNERKLIMSVFFCDTNCELSYRKVEELGIRVIVMPYTLDGEVGLPDLGKSGNEKVFFDKMRAGAQAKTQALNSNDYMEYFRPVFADGEDILYVSFSHQLSGTFNYMQTAIDELKAEFPERKITVVDTKEISMGAGLIVMEAAKRHNAGESDEDVAAFVEDAKNYIRTYFTVGDLKYLVRGGRLSAFSGAMGNLLDLKPIIYTNEEGRLVNILKAKGRKRSIHTLVEKLEHDCVDTQYPIIILNGDTDAAAQLFYNLVTDKYPDASVSMQMVGPVIGSHCGPDTLGIIFFSKNKRAE